MYYRFRRKKRQIFITPNKSGWDFRGYRKTNLATKWNFMIATMG